MPFDDKSSFSLNILREIQGMANGGGGVIVVGFKEGSDGLLRGDPSHTDEIAGTYEPTVLSEQVNSSVVRGQHVALSVHFEQHPESGRRHPIITVQPFERTPVVCRSRRTAADTGKVILEECAVYIRREGAETSKVSSARDWEELITRATAVRRNEFLHEFRGLLDMMVLNTAAPAPADASFDEFKLASQLRARGLPP